MKPFDVYGTLIDWETGIVEAFEPLTNRRNHSLTRDQILAVHARHEHVQQQYTPAKLYRDLLPIVYRRIAEEWGITVEECLAYGRSVWRGLPRRCSSREGPQQRWPSR